MPDSPLLHALLAPLDELYVEYEKTLASLGQIVGDLAATRARIGTNSGSGAALDAPSAASPSGLDDRPAPRATTGSLRPIAINVAGASFEQLLGLQQLLSAADDVVSVAITELDSERTILLVNMAEPNGTEDRNLHGNDASHEAPPTLVCAWCETVLSVGGPALSRGLCAPCAAPFADHNQR